MRRHRALLTLVTALAVLTATVGAAVTAVPESVAAPAATAADRPNVVFIVADDMRADDLAYMPAVNRLLVD